MTSELEKWTIVEEHFLKDDLKWMKAGAKLISPSGDDITQRKIEELKMRLEHAQKVLRAVEPPSEAPADPSHAKTDK